MANESAGRSRLVYSGRVVRVTIDDVVLPNGRTCELEIIRHPGAPAVVPMDADGSLLLIRQYRYASGGWLLEVPAGKLDRGEAPETCALREVEEETGFRPRTLVDLGWIWTTPGFTDERIWLYLARDLEAGRQDLLEDEALSVVRVPFADAVRMAERGEIQDAKSVCALLRAGRDGERD